MADFRIQPEEVPEVPGACELRLSGSLQTAAVPPLREALDARLRKKDLSILLNMTDLSYISSAGFGYLLDLSNDLEKRGGLLVLMDVQTKVKLVLENLGISRYFRFEAARDAALELARSHGERILHAPRITILEGPGAGREIPVVGTGIRIGSDARATIQIRHPKVELRHAEIYRDGDGCCVRDLGTRHGTLVGDRKVNDEPLSPGDVVKIGNCRLLYSPAKK